MLISLNTISQNYTGIYKCIESPKQMYSQYKIATHSSFKWKDDYPTKDQFFASMLDLQVSTT